MQYLILYIVLALICIPKFSVNDKNAENVLSIMSKVNLLRGVFAILIIYTHCSMEVNPLPVILFPLRKVSTFGVGFFFVLSGYGLAYSFNKRTDYLKGFLPRKLSKILITALISRIITDQILHFLFGDVILLIGIIEYMNWYIYSLIVLYLFFYLVYKYCLGRSARVIGIWFLTVAMTFTVLYITNNVYHLGRSYYISQWAFSMGISIYEFHDEIDEWMKKHFLILDVVMAILLCVSFILALKADEYTVLDLVSHNLMLLPFFYFVMVICKYIKFDNPVLRFLNGISFEIYLYQFMVLAILKKTFPSLNVIYFLLATVCTIAFAWVVNVVFKRVQILMHRSR